MSKIYLLVVASVTLSACVSPKFISDELRQLKPACVAGDFAVCSDIGHKVRRAQAEGAYLAKAQ